MILTDREIKIALSKGQFAIDPEPQPDAYSSTAVDLTLDGTLRRFKKTVSGGLSLSPAESDYRFHDKVDLLTEKVELRPDCTIRNGDLLLAWTREYVELPVTSRIAARVEGKSSLARLGLGVHITAPTIHAGFKGQLQLEIVNHGPANITLGTGMKICQLIFETTLGAPEKGYAGVFSGQQAQ